MLRTLCKHFIPTRYKQRLQCVLSRCFILLIRLVSMLPCEHTFTSMGLKALRLRHTAVPALVGLVLLERQKRYACTSQEVIMPMRVLPANADLRLSVIIPTFNRAAMLPALFDSLLAQTLDSHFFEIIVVDNNCTDRTDEICSLYAPRFPYFKVVRENEQSLLSARHAGWQAAATNILVFCDDDIEALPTWLATIDDAFTADSSIGLMGGNNIGKFETALPPWFALLWHEEHGLRINAYYSLLEGILKPMRAPNAQLVFGCNYAIRRQALEAAGGFEPDCMQHVLFQGGGETGIAVHIAQSWNVLLHPGASVYHRMPDTRLSMDYMEKRCVYFTSSSSYDNFRKGLFPSARPVDTKLLKSIGVKDIAAKGSTISFVEAVLRFPSFRYWIIRRSYFGHETPPADALAWARTNAHQGTWHTTL